MSYKIKRVMSLMIAVFVAFGMMVVSTGEANAASGKVKLSIYGNSGEKQLYVGEEVYVGAFNPKDTDTYIPVKGITVADKSIAKVKKSTYKYEGKKYTDYFIVGKKPGKVKITVKYKYKGKVASKKATVTVKAYPNPIQGLEINGKNVSLSQDKKFGCDKKYKKSKTKVAIKITPSEGWKIVGAYGETYYVKGKSYKSKEVKNTSSKIKNGKEISFPKKYKNLSVSVFMENEKGETFNYYVYLYR